MLARKVIEPYERPKVYIAQNNAISNSITQTWTQQAVECFEIDSDCTKCSIYNGGYSFICQMPKVVKQLLDSIGKPIID